MNPDRNIRIGIVQRFDSMHFLPGHAKCGAEHGHTYKVEVTLEGPVQNGMVMDFDHLKEKIKTILKDFDHTNLNKIISYPSSENLCLEIHKRLRELLPQPFPLAVRIWEGDGKWAEYMG